MKQDQINALVTEFCKATKASKTKTMELAQAIAAIYKPTSGTGRKASEKVVNLREQIKHDAPMLKGVTAKALAARYGVTANDANNVLLYLSKQGIVKQAGKADKPANVRGKAATLWEGV